MEDRFIFSIFIKNGYIRYISLHTHTINRTFVSDRLKLHINFTSRFR